MNLFFAALFRGDLKNYEEIVKSYVDYWSRTDTSYEFENFCLPCILNNGKKGKELFDLYYCCNPLTPEIIADAATVLIITSATSRVHARELIISLHPFSVVYHLFFNCCFARQNDGSISSSSPNNFSNLLIDVAVKYWYFDEINFKRISWTLKRSISAASCCAGNCGQFKRDILTVTSTQDSAKETSFAGEEFTDQDVGTNEMEAIKIYSEKRLSISYRAVSKRKHENLEGKINAFDCFQSCRICSTLPLYKSQKLLRRWESAYEETTKTLIGSNVLTCIKATLKNIPYFLENVSAEDIYHHKTSNFCRFNRDRFIQFFDTFSDVNKIYDTAKVKHFAGIFLRDRNCLPCADRYFAMWIENIMCFEKNCYNEKISGFVDKVFRIHDL